MRNIKQNLLLLVVFSSFCIIGCSREDGTNVNASSNSKISTFLKTFYSKDFQLGRSIESRGNKTVSSSSRTEEVEDLLITEVFVGDSPIARGYIITDKSTNDILYFIDVDRVDYKLTSIKVEEDETKIFNNINELDRYLSTDEFDIIMVAEEYNANPELFDKRRFFGSSYSQGPCNESTGLAQLYDDYYVFGIRTHHGPSIGVDGGEVWEPCGMH